MVGGVVVKEGEGIIAATQSGNRDEDVVSNPDVFDIRRARLEEEALGYGWGEHRCVAEWLARAELEIVFGELDLCLIAHVVTGTRACSYAMEENSKLEACDSI